ncbi:MAG: response regulator, partial [Spirochaetaceae bacterium]
MINQATVLIIDDSVSSLSALSDLLEGGDYRIRQAQSGQSGIDIALQSPPDLIMLDIDMPDADGFEVCRQLKANTITADIPVIFVSGIQDVENKVKAFHAGGVDYITKPYQSEEVLARVMTQLQLLESRRNIEKARKTMEQWNATLEKHVTDRTRDIMRNERRMRFLAMHDSLTQLPNRNALQEALT